MGLLGESWHPDYNNNSEKRDQLNGLKEKGPIEWVLKKGHDECMIVAEWLDI